MMDDPSYPEEELVFSCRTHPKVLVPHVAAFLVLGFIEIFLLRNIPEASNDFWMWSKVALHAVVWIAMGYLAIYPAARWYLDTFELTTERAISHRGVIYRDTQEITARRISQVIMERGLLDRIFACGTLKLYDSANTLGLEFKDVPRVLAKKAAIDEARSSARRSNDY